MYKKITLLLLFFSLLSCTPQKRLERLLIKFPQLTIKDTLFYRDTFIVERTNFDTAFLLKLDTFFFENLRIITTKDSFFIKSYFKPDTIIVSKNIPVEKIKYIKPDNINKFLKLIPYICLSIVVVAGISAFKKFIT